MSQHVSAGTTGCLADARSRSLNATPNRRLAPCLAFLAFWLIVGLTAACSFDASRLRASPSHASDGDAEHSPVTDSSVPDRNFDLPLRSDTPTGTGGSVAATGGSGGSDRSVETGGSSILDSPIAMGGAASSDVPIATGGTGMGGNTGADDAGSSNDSSELIASSGGLVSGGAGGGAGAAAISSGGSASGGQMGTGGSNGGGGDTGGSGGLANSGGSGGGGTGGTSSTGGAGGAICGVGQCPAIATLGITGPWGMTFTKVTYGNMVTTGDTTFSTWLASGATNCAVQNLDISGTNYLTAARLAPYQVIIVLDLYHTQADKNAFINAKKTIASPPYTGTQRALLASEVNAITTWVHNGGGLMTTIGIVGTAAEMANANLLLNPFGIAYSVTNMQVLAGPSAITDLTTAPPIASLIDAGVKALSFNAGVSIEGPRGARLPASSNTFVIYAGSGSTSSGGGGYAVGVATIIGTGRVNVWGDDWITYDVAWSDGASQVRTYWNNVLSWLGQCQ